MFQSDICLIIVKYDTIPKHNVDLFLSLFCLIIVKYDTIPKLISK